MGNMIQVGPRADPEGGREGTLGQSTGSRAGSPGRRRRFHEERFKPQRTLEADDRASQTGARCSRRRPLAEPPGTCHMTSGIGRGSHRCGSAGASPSRGAAGLACRVDQSADALC